MRTLHQEALGVNLPARVRSGRTPKCLSFNALNSACEKSGQWQRALRLPEEMARRSLAPDVVTYNALIGACGRGK